MVAGSIATVSAVRATPALWEKPARATDSGGTPAAPPAANADRPAAVAQAVQQTLQAAPGEADAPDRSALMRFAHALAHVLRGDDDGPGRHRGRGRGDDDDGEREGRGRHDGHRQGSSQGLREYRALEGLPQRLNELAAQVRSGSTPAAPPAAPVDAPAAAATAAADSTTVTPAVSSAVTAPRGDRWLQRLLQAFEALQPAPAAPAPTPPDGSELRQRLASFLEQLAGALQATTTRSCGCGQLLNLDA